MSSKNSRSSSTSSSFSSSSSSAESEKHTSNTMFKKLRRSEGVAVNTIFGKFANKLDDPIIKEEDQEVNDYEKAIVVFTTPESTVKPLKVVMNKFTKKRISGEVLKQTSPTKHETRKLKRSRSETDEPRSTKNFEKQKGVIRDEKKIKIKSRMVHHAIRTRMSPKTLFNVIQSLNKEQKKALVEIGFGPMLEMKVDGIPSKLGHYVVDVFDPKKMRLKLKNGYIDVTRESIHDMIGVPSGGTMIHSLETRAPDHPLLFHWKSQFGDKSIRARDIMRRIVADEDAGIIFKLNFLVLFVNTMSESKSSGKCNLSILPYIIQDVDVDISSLDWCGLILDSLKVSKIGWSRLDANCYYTGPLTVLTLLYLDATKCIKVPVVRQRPTIKSWNVELMRSRELAEIEDGGFGRGEIQQSFEAATNQPTDVEGYISMLESKFNILLDLKRDIESTLTDALSKFPDNEILKQWVKKLNDLFGNADSYVEVNRAC